MPTSLRTVSAFTALAIALAGGCAGSGTPGADGGLLPDPALPPPIAVSEEKAESLLAYYSAPDETLFVTNAAKLTGGGAWTGIEWKRGADEARVPIDGDRRNVVVIEMEADELVDRPAADGDTRWINVTRSRVRNRGTAGTCRPRGASTPLPETLGSKGGETPPDSQDIRGLRLDGVTYHETFQGGGREKAAERVSAVMRLNFYTARDCSSGYAGSAGVSYAWIVEQGLWPDP